MSTRARYHPRGIEVDLASLEPWLYREIASLHGQIDPPPAPPVLTCLGNGLPMYVYRHSSGRFFIRHYPGGSPDGHQHVFAAMSDQHRRQTEYAARAADDNGLEAHTEHSTGNGTRLDLAVLGRINTGFEIQRSTLSRAQAKLRAAKSFDAGWPTAWVTDAERAPDWADQVPTARLTTGLDWSSLPARNTAKVIIGRFALVRDRRKPGGWAYRREPYTVLLDELVPQMTAGEITPVAVGAKGLVSLAHKTAVEVIDSCTYPGASQWRPSPSTPRTREAPQRYSAECHHEGDPGLDLPGTRCFAAGQETGWKVCGSLWPTYGEWLEHYCATHIKPNYSPPRKDER